MSTKIVGMRSKTKRMKMKIEETNESCELRYQTECKEKRMRSEVVRKIEKFMIS